MGEQVRSSSKTIRLLFLGCYRTDRRIKSFARYFSSNGFQTEIIYGEPGKNEQGIRNDGDIRITQLPMKRSSGPLMFLEYRRKLNKHLSSLSGGHITFACDLYSLSAARKIKLRGQTDK